MRKVEGHHSLRFEVKTEGEAEAIEYAKFSQWCGAGYRLHTFETNL